MKDGKILIIHIISNLESGGGQRHLLDIIRFSDPTKFQHRVIILKKAGLLESDFRKTGTELFILGQKFKASPSLFLRVFQILKKEKPDIVMTNFFGGHFYGRIAAKFIGKIKIVGMEDVVPRRESALKILLKKIVLNRLADKIIACSEEVADWLEKSEGVPRRKIKVIHYGIDRERFTPKPFLDEKLATRSEIIIGTVAIPKKQKGLRYLIAALPEINKLFPQVKLWLVGGARQDLPDNEEEYLRQLTRNLKLEEKITFLGDQKDIPGILKKMDIFVLPSLFEGFGIVILEAWAAGLPVISSRLKCIQEYAIDEKNILFCSPGNSEDIIQKTTRLITDDNLRNKLSADGLKKVEDFDIRKVVKKYENVFQKLLN